MKIDRISLDVVDSTNSFAKQMIGTFDPNALTIITANRQTNGRGRFSRTWASEPSTNLLITFSLFLPPQTADLFRIGQLFSLSCLFLLLEEKFDAFIKWPNDLLIGGKKIGGILTEMQQINGLYQVILGLGLNVNADEPWLSSLDQPATSLFLESKKTWDLEYLTKKLGPIFLKNLDLFLKKGFIPFQEKFISHLAFLGQKIKCGSLEGIFEGVDFDGALLLKLNDGSLKKIVNEQ